MADPRQGRASTERRRRLIADGGTCAECGAGDTPDNPLHVDHIYPLSKGGTDDESNIQLLCRRHNLSKSDKTDRKRANWYDPQWLSSLK